MYFFSKSEVHLKFTSFKQNSRSINEVLVKYEQITFLFFIFSYNINSFTVTNIYKFNHGSNSKVIQKCEQGRTNLRFG